VKNTLIRKETQFRIIYLFIIAALAILSIWGGYAGTNYNFLNERNSIEIRTIDFTPNFSIHRIKRDKVGKHVYIYSFSKDRMQKLENGEFKIIISRLTDNAIKIRLNGRLLASEGDFKNGRSMFKNSFIYGSFDSNDILEQNILEVETFALYKSGIEAKNIIITEGVTGMKLINIMEFHGSTMIILAFGFLFFSSIFALYIYFVSDEKDIIFIYCSIATLSLSIFFIDYIKIINLPFDYFIFKRIFLLGLAIGTLFYLMIIKTFIKANKLSWFVFAHFAWYISIMMYSKDLIEFKTLYEYWYFGLIAIIMSFFLVFIKNRKRGDSRIHIFMIIFALLGTYTGFVVITEFSGGYFALNSPLIYMTTIAILPLLLGFDAIKNKERKIIIEQKEKERAFLTSLEDSLTCAWNKRYFDIILDKIDEHDTLAMIDFDDFKNINDTFGHAAGDYILKKIAKIINKSIRKGDELCRVGGDEFIVVFTNCSQDNALKIMQKLQNTLSEENFLFNEKNIKATISIGICGVTKDAEKIFLLEKLDGFLYEAKRNGKNTIVRDIQSTNLT